MSFGLKGWHVLLVAFVGICGWGSYQSISSIIEMELDMNKLYFVIHVIFQS